MSDTDTYDGDGLPADRTADRPFVLRMLRSIHLCDMGATQAQKCGVAVFALAILLVCAAPAAVGATDESPMAIVVLPPRFVSGGSDQTMAAAELACDRLARELEKSASLRVVDRTQLDRVLKERGLDGNSSRPLLSYDIMARLEVDAVRPAPKAWLSLMDLSHGNVIAEVEFAWSVPVPDAAIRDMTQTCLGAARDLTADKPKALRVRMLEVQNPGKSARLEPLAARLSDTFAAALNRSKGVRLVHHFEAATGKEESLLLTLGLSRLGGGRQFAPQSDATVELRIRELDGVGKTFAQTQVEVAWRIRRGADYSGNWMTTEAPVRDFDDLLKAAWARFAKELGRASPQAAGDYLNEMALRRKQAHAELDACDWRMDVPREVALQRLAHCAAAVKLDPTWDEAARRLVAATVYDYHSPACYRAGIVEAWRYIDRFRADRKQRTLIAGTAMFWAGSGFLKLRDLEGTEELDADARAALDALKRIVDAFAAGPADDLPDLLPLGMHIVYRGMVNSGVSIGDRREWLERIVRLGSRDVSTATHSPEVHLRKVLETRLRLRLHAAQLILTEGDPASARPYVEQLLPLFLAAKTQKSDVDKFYRLARGLNDPELLARLDAALAGVVWPAKINWLDHNAPGMMPPAGTRPRAKVTTLQYAPHVGATPLAICGQRLYCTVPGEGPKDVPRIGFVTLESRGRPAGKITLLPRQPQVWPKHIVTTAITDSRLYIGTRGQGLLEYDPDSGKWRTIGPEQGLPGRNVYTLLALDDGTLFCHGGGDGKQGFFCRINPRTSEITLLRRLAHDSGRNPLVDSSIRPAWKAGDNIVGFADGGALYTLPRLGVGEPVRQPWPTQKSGVPYDSLPDGMAVVASKRFIMCRDALCEIDDGDKVIRTWARPEPTRVTPGPADLPGQDILFASDQPDLISRQEYRCVAQDDSHVFFLDDWILCYEPSSDTWYGPLETEPWTNPTQAVVSGRSGIWFGADQSLVYLETADFITAAKKARRVITGQEFRRRRDEAVAASPPLERAKWALSMRRFDKSRELCAAVLEGDANNVEALLVMALLHESCCLNQPDRAMEYYGRLVAVEDNPAARFMGLVHQYRLHIDAKRYADALRVGRLIEQRYPRNAVSETIARYNEWLSEQIEPMSSGKSQ